MPLTRWSHKLGIKGQAISLQRLDISPIPLLSIKMGFRPAQKGETAIPVDFNEMSEDLAHPLVIVEGNIKDII
jgi:hypothetical protein